MLPVFGYDDAPHGHMEIELTCARAAENMLLGEGRGFEIAQGASGRAASITACARSASPRKRSRRWRSGCSSRVAFGKKIAEYDLGTAHRRARIDIEMTRLLCLKAADMMDKAGNKAASSRSR
jgi:acyl-CoA dehydrogenase